MSSIDDLFSIHSKRSGDDLEENDHKKSIKLNQEDVESAETLNQEDTIMNYINERELEIGNDTSLEDESSLKKLLVKFERAVTLNAEQRSKYYEDPIKFLPSEEALHTTVKSLSSLATIPSLYPTFISIGSLSTLISLLGHENSDIADSTVKVLKELTDQDIAEDSSDSSSVERLAKIMVTEENILDCIIIHLERLAMEEKEGGSNMEELVLNSLSLLENLAEFDDLSSILMSDKKINWLSNNIRECKFISPDRIKQYCLELVFILLQSAPGKREEFLRHSPQLIDTLLVNLSGYISGSHKEDEIGPNCINILQILVSVDSGREEFLVQEGVELMILFIKTMSSATTSRWIKEGALNVLVDAINSFKSEPVAKRVVECGGLGAIFGNFSKAIKKISSFKREDNNNNTTDQLPFDRKLVENLITVIANLLRLLSDESEEYIRVIGKLTELDFSKLIQIIQVRTIVAENLATIEREIEVQKLELLKQVDEDDPEYAEADTEWYIRQLNGGLEIVKKIDLIIAWLYLDEGDYKTVIENILLEHGGGCTWQTIKANLLKYKEELVISDPDDMVDVPYDEELNRINAESIDQNEMYTYLIENL